MSNGETTVGRELLRVEEVQAVLGIGRSKVYAMLAQGELPVIRLGRVVRVPRGELARWIAEHTVWDREAA